MVGPTDAPARRPAAPTTRWHGTIREMELRPTAPPTARAEGRETKGAGEATGGEARDEEERDGEARAGEATGGEARDEEERDEEAMDGEAVDAEERDAAMAP